MGREQAPIVSTSTFLATSVAVVARTGMARKSMLPPAAMKSLGVKSGDRVAVLSATRYEWTVIDLAILSLGAVTVPIYHSTLPKDIFYILNQAQVRLIFVENAAQAKKIETIRKELPPQREHLLEDLHDDGGRAQGGYAPGSGEVVDPELHDLELVRSMFPEALLLAREPVAWGATREVLTAENLLKARRMCEAFDEDAAACAVAAE